MLQPEQATKLQGDFSLESVFLERSRELFQELNELSGSSAISSLKESNASRSVSLLNLQATSVAVVKNNTKLSSFIL
ncbi:hypothetical protein RHGRI_038864 [Rhododendron griersonianum]|uniref:Uncharacterized protein n=1 Tax=Rhododendron griersonianum TaxID=479676 RepID=A0AAV6HI21_9ERIC|nr:hypothetical protein RHGRI_038864 [Rhododendron griersonianum]